MATIYEISNPSDPYTLESDDFAAVLCAVGIPGTGMYGADPISGEGPSVPITLGSDYPAETYQAAGIEPRSIEGFNKFMEDKANKIRVAVVLEGVRFGHTRDRDRPPEWGEEHRSSMNNIGGSAQAIAKSLRKAAKAKREKVS